MPEIADHKISLPTIARVALANFDLYSNEPNASADIERPVFCLIGANGLGKSTFLNTINFAITGAIPDPSRKFQSAQDYLRNAGRADRADDYFSGRISEHARPIASVTVDLAWATTTLSVTRDLFGNAGVGVDGPRLVLVNRPESIMRDSLIQALQLVLRDANARPEHNTDETKPVDVRVE